MLRGPLAIARRQTRIRSPLDVFSRLQKTGLNNVGADLVRKLPGSLGQRITHEMAKFYASGAMKRLKWVRPHTFLTPHFL